MTEKKHQMYKAPPPQLPNPKRPIFAKKDMQANSHSEIETFFFYDNKIIKLFSVFFWPSVSVKYIQ